MSPLHAAASENHKEITALLIIKGADVNVKNDDDEPSLIGLKRKKTRTWPTSSASTAARRVKN
jgi:ankyrin repeat protein